MGRGLERIQGPAALASPRLIALLFLLSISPLQADRIKPPEYWTYHANFHRLILKLSWAKGMDRKTLDEEAWAIWDGSGSDYWKAGHFACIGIMESHYVLPHPALYNNYRGHFGGHNHTLLVEVKRCNQGGRKSMWLAYWKKNPINADYWSAHRFSRLMELFKTTRRTESAWVDGEPDNSERGRKYANEVEKLYERYFNGYQKP